MSVKRNKRERGFTLIELISVIIILGILAAVITPKYFDMTGKAQEAAYKGALSEGAARFNLAYASFVMGNGTAATKLSDLAEEKFLGTDVTNVVVGDYSIGYVESGTVATPATHTVTMTLYDKTKSKTLKTGDPFQWPQ